MKIDQAKAVVKEELDSGAGTLGTSPTPTMVDDSRAKPAAKAYRPILPFFSVLFRGRDDAWEWGAVAQADRHPTVGYVQVIYFAIALNWIVDLAGMTYMFHTYLVSWDVPAVQWGVPMALAAVFSTGFAAFAVSLVRKPLRKPRTPRLSRWAVVAVLVPLVLCLVVILATQAFGDIESQWLTFAALLAWSLLGLGTLVVFFIAFGVVDAFYIFSRGVVMVFVGYLVADPLHEVMFEKELEDAFYGKGLDEVKAAIADLERVGDEWLQRREKAEKLCTKRHTVTEKQSCDDWKKRADLFALEERAYEALMDDEYRGTVNEARREKIRSDATKLQLEGVLQLLGERPRASGQGRRWEAYQKSRNSASENRNTATKSLGDCEKNPKSEYIDMANRNACIDALEKEEGKRGAERAKKRNELLLKRVRLENRVETMGAIDRALALQDLIERAASSRQRTDAAEGERSKRARRERADTTEERKGDASGETRIEAPGEGQGEAPGEGRGEGQREAPGEEQGEEQGEAPGAAQEGSDTVDLQSSNTVDEHENDAVVRAMDVSKAQAVVERKLVAAWFMALVMPLIVVTMKLTGGSRLEPYLQRRWQEH